MAQMGVVVMGQEMRGDLVAGSVPDAVVAADVVEDLAQMADVVRLADLVGVQGDADTGS